MTLKNEMAEYLHKQTLLNLPKVWEAPVSLLRRNLENRPALSGAPENIHQIEHRFIAGPTAELPIRIYRPHWHAPLPVIIFFHGGGWVLNSLDIYDQPLRSLANKGQFVVIAVNYQKAPEHPFPIPFDDCFATLEWVMNRAEELGIDTHQVGVAGDSAGGNLAAAVALKARDVGISLAFSALIYPCIDPSMNFESARNNAEGFGLTTRGMKWFWEQYLSRKSDAKNPYAVPITSQDLSGLPPTIIVTAEYDPLLDDGYNYAEALRRSGVRVLYREYEGQIHGFFSLGAITPDANTLHQNLADEINAILETR